MIEDELISPAEEGHLGYSKIDVDLLNEIQEIIPAGRLLYKREDIERYSHDETEDLRFYPELVVLPESVEEISRLLSFCTQYHIPVTARGAGTGLAGGALPVFGGIVLSLERLDRVLEIDERNLQATVESGIITQKLMDAAAEKGLLYPIDPASKGSCFIGGNIANGSGGPRVVKYGTIRDYVLNLEVVLPSGEVIWTGANTLKNSSGYSLTQLFIGSEGMLGIVTKAVLKLVPKPKHDMLMMASFPSNELACEAVGHVFRNGIVPSALEFMERTGIEWVMRYDDVHFDLKEGAQAFLLIELDGNNTEILMEEAEAIFKVLDAHQAMDVLLADTVAQKEALWNMRRRMGVSVKSNSVYKEEDTVVPRAELPKLISGVKVLGKKYGFGSICYGHAGDGNLHINIIKGAMSDADWATKLKEGIKELFELTVALGGTISGEHGIGLVQRQYMPIKYSHIHLALLKGIKQLFDPKNILNPGKIY
ncbi:FAD-binding oxidoreductase [Olivibacter sitiensis]|uniref:FAD-binding oxidoreductase n=1 Tax=Olivibacter sitiensis TaxID=376470 RepID=UPI0003FB552D|nr:FAD-linked oxidase C-terminal domain-containing protein [Olivibacter sitiensis]